MPHIPTNATTVPSFSSHPPSVPLIATPTSQPGRASSHVVIFLSHAQPQPSKASRKSPSILCRIASMTTQLHHRPPYIALTGGHHITRFHTEVWCGTLGGEGGGEEETAQLRSKLTASPIPPLILGLPQSQLIIGHSILQLMGFSRLTFTCVALWRHRRCNCDGWKG